MDLYGSRSYLLPVTNADLFWVNNVGLPQNQFDSLLNYFNLSYNNKSIVSQSIFHSQTNVSYLN